MGRWSNKYVIGLTGNIATGKSVVRQMLQHLGAYTIDADGLSNQAMQPGAPAYKPVVQKFGAFILDENKRINRQMLAQIVFSNPAALQQLESIVHPIVRRAVDTLVKRSKQRVVVIEAIKLTEGEMSNWVDATWVVDASPKTQLTRLVTKRKMSQQEATTRMQAQNPQSEKLKQADVVIKNDSDVEQTWKQVQAAWQDVKKAVTGQQPAPKPTSPAGSATPPAAQQAAQDAAKRAADAVSTPTSIQAGDIEVVRGNPDNAGAIAAFLTKHGEEEVSRMDIMMSFGSKSYMIAEGTGDDLVAVLGWQVENLITCVDEFYMDKGAPMETVVQGTVAAVEEASTDLQSEVCFIFLPNSTPSGKVNAFRNHGYEMTGIRDIKIPAWREAVQEIMSQNDGYQILMKKLRDDRVLKPI